MDFNSLLVSFKHVLDDKILKALFMNNAVMTKIRYLDLSDMNFITNEGFVLTLDLIKDRKWDPEGFSFEETTMIDQLKDIITMPF
jgi:hypothetical protein